MPSLPDLIQELCSGDDQRAEPAALTLEKYGSEAISKLAKLSQSTNADHRWWAIRSLAEFPGEQTTNILIIALSDPEESVRYCAALAMRNHKAKPTIHALIAILDDVDAMQARLAADALISIGVDAVEPLLTLVDNSSSQAPIEAIRALATIADHRVISALFALLDSPSALLNYWAEFGLEKMGVGMTFFEPT